ncbi:hypothetical protein D3C74_442300 [compost metagenome]
MDGHQHDFAVQVLIHVRIVFNHHSQIFDDFVNQHAFFKILAKTIYHILSIVSSIF